MLNSDYKQQAMDDLQKANAAYVDVFQAAVWEMERLQHTRKTAVGTIKRIENYVISLSNKPQDFDTRIEKIQVNYNDFLDVEKKCRASIRDAERKQEAQGTAGHFGAAGALGGVGVAALGPTAAVAVAMTFGTASTGTAIASLSGAAATNAALAWLGGGALVANGAGMAAGETLLTLAGPVGWAIAGVSLAACLASINLSNKKIAEKTEESIREIKKQMERIKEIACKVNELNRETKDTSNMLMSRMISVRSNRKMDWRMFSKDEMFELQSIFNATEVLSEKLRETVHGSDK